MPKALDNQLFPVSFEPWYATKVTMDSTSTAGNKYDIITPTATGTFIRDVTNNDVLNDGYMIALEPFAAGTRSIQAAMPGSSVPQVAGAALKPGSWVKLQYSGTDGQRSAPATVADFQAGRCYGRVRRPLNVGGASAVRQKAFVANDKIEVLTF